MPHVLGFAPVRDMDSSELQTQTAQTCGGMLARWVEVLCLRLVHATVHETLSGNVPCARKSARKCTLLEETRRHSARPLTMTIRQGMVPLRGCTSQKRGRFCNIARHVDADEVIRDLFHVRGAVPVWEVVFLQPHQLMNMGSEHAHTG